MDAVLYVNPISPFARKAMIINRLSGLSIVEITPKADETSGYMAKLNPLGKIPALAVDGQLIVDSPVICELLDQQGKNWLAQEADSIAARSLHAIGDGLATAVYDYRYETVRDPALHWEKMITRKTEAIKRTISFLETRLEALSGPISGASWGGLAVATALDYADFRAPHVPWRDLAPGLANWHARISRSPAFQDTNGYPPPKTAVR